MVYQEKLLSSIYRSLKPSLKEKVRIIVDLASKTFMDQVYAVLTVFAALKKNGDMHERQYELFLNEFCNELSRSRIDFYNSVQSARMSRGSEYSKELIANVNDIAKVFSINKFELEPFRQIMKTVDYIIQDETPKYKKKDVDVNPIMFATPESINLEINKENVDDQRSIKNKTTNAIDFFSKSSTFSLEIQEELIRIESLDSDKGLNQLSCFNSSKISTHNSANSSNGNRMMSRKINLLDPDSVSKYHGSQERFKNGMLLSNTINYESNDFNKVAFDSYASIEDNFRSIEYETLNRICFDEGSWIKEKTTPKRDTTVVTIERKDEPEFDYHSFTDSQIKKPNPPKSSNNSFKKKVNSLFSKGPDRGDLSKKEVAISPLNTELKGLSSLDSPESYFDMEKSTQNHQSSPSPARLTIDSFFKGREPQRLIVGISNNENIWAGERRNRIYFGGDGLHCLEIEDQHIKIVRNDKNASKL